MSAAERPRWIDWGLGTGPGLAAVLLPFLMLLTSGAVQAAVGPGSTTTTTSITSSIVTTPTTTTTSSTVFATRVVGRLNGQIVFDQTVASAFGSAGVTAALAQAEAAVLAAGGTGTTVGSPQLISSGTTPTTTTTSLFTLTGSTTTRTTETTFGLGTILIGGTDVCAAAIATLPGATRPVCSPADRVTFFVAAGTINTNTNDDIAYFVDEAITVNTVTTIGETYEVAGTNLNGRPDPTTDVSVNDLIDQQHNLVAAMADDQHASFAKRLNELHGTDPGGSSAGVVVVDAYAPGVASPGSTAIDMALGPEGTMASALGFWTDTRLTLTDPGGAALDIGRGTVTFGADYRFNDWATLGAGAGLATGHTAVGPDGQQSSASAFYTAVYGSLLPTDNIFVDGVLGIGIIDLSSTRYVSFNDALAQGRRGGSQVFGSLAAGYDAELEDWALSGYGRIEATFARLAGFTETGGGPGGALSFAPQDLWSVTGLLGASAGYSFHLENGTLTPSVRAEYRRNIQGSSDSSIAYADLPGTPFGLGGSQVAGDSVVLGLETEFAFSSGLTIALGGDVRVGTDGTVSKSVSFYLGGQL